MWELGGSLNVTLGNAPHPRHGRLLGTSRAEIGPISFQPSRSSHDAGRRTKSGS